MEAGALPADDGHSDGLTVHQREILRRRPMYLAALRRRFRGLLTFEDCEEVFQDAWHRAADIPASLPSREAQKLFKWRLLDKCGVDKVRAVTGRSKSGKPTRPQVIHLERLNARNENGEPHRTRAADRLQPPIPPTRSPPRSTRRSTSSCCAG